MVRLAILCPTGIFRQKYLRLFALQYPGEEIFVCRRFCLPVSLNIIISNETNSFTLVASAYYLPEELWWESPAPARISHEPLRHFECSVGEDAEYSASSSSESWTTFTLISRGLTCRVIRVEVQNILYVRNA